MRQALGTIEWLGKFKDKREICLREGFAVHQIIVFGPNPNLDDEEISWSAILTDFELVGDEIRAKCEFGVPDAPQERLKEGAFFTIFPAATPCLQGQVLKVLRLE